MTAPNDENEDIFEPLRSNAVLDYDKLEKLVDALKSVGKRIVVTIGTYDGVHEGHSRYLYKAKQAGDVLVVGLDSDVAVKRYKGEHRPLVSQNRRMEMLLHLGYPDYVTLIDDVDEAGRWQYELISRLRPDVFVAVEDSYPPEQLEEIRAFCNEVQVFPRQSVTSTSEQIRQAAMMLSAGPASVLRRLADAIESGENLDFMGRTLQ